MLMCNNFMAVDLVINDGMVTKNHYVLNFALKEAVVEFEKV